MTRITIAPLVHIFCMLSLVVPCFGIVYSCCQWLCVLLYGCMVVFLVFVCVSIVLMARSHLSSFLCSFCIYLILLFFDLFVLYIYNFGGLFVDIVSRGQLWFFGYNEDMGIFSCNNGEIIRLFVHNFMKKFQLYIYIYTMASWLILNSTASHLAYIYTHTHTHTYTYIYIHTYVRTHTHTYIYLCVCVCAYVCTYVCVCLYIYIYIHTHVYV